MTPKKIEQTGHMETAFGASRGVMALGGDIVTGAHPQGLDAPRIPGHPAGQPAGRPLEGWPASRPPWDRQRLIAAVEGLEPAAAAIMDSDG